MGEKQSDAELVEQARLGSDTLRKVAFGQLVARYEAYVRAMLRSLTGSDAVAEDLAQDVFLTAWLRLESLQNPAAFAGWLKQLAYRQFLHHIRRGEVERRHAAAVENGQESAAVPMVLPLDGELAALLALCSPMEQELMVLCYAFEFTYAEIATARGMAEGTVKSHVHRAKQKMRRHLGRTAATTSEGNCIE